MARLHWAIKSNYETECSIFLLQTTQKKANDILLLRAGHVCDDEDE